MKADRGDVVMVDFPFGEGISSKLRPAVVIQCDADNRRLVGAHVLMKGFAMPAAKAKAPKYCLHKPSGRAYIRIRGRVRYIGEHGTQESLETYGRLVAEIAAQPDVSATVLNVRRRLDRRGRTQRAHHGRGRPRSCPSRKRSSRPRFPTCPKSWPTWSVSSGLASAFRSGVPMPRIRSSRPLGRNSRTCRRPR